MITLGNCQALLIGCGGKKRRERSMARDLYTSGYFKLKVAFATSLRKPWAVLSAKHGILMPERKVHPYDLSLGDLDEAGVRRWAEDVAEQFLEWQLGATRIAIVAGDRYFSALIEPLDFIGVEIMNPCKGLGIGKQMAWLKRNAR